MDPPGYLNSSSPVRTDRKVTARRASQKRIEIGELDEFDEAIVTLLASTTPPPPSTASASSNGFVDVLRNMPILSSIPYFASGDNQQDSTPNDQQQHEQCRPTTTTSPQQNSNSVSCIDLSLDDDDNAIEIIDIKPCKRRKLLHRPNSLSAHRPRPHTPNPSSPPSIVDICDSPSPSASGSKSDLDTTPLKP